MNRVEDGSTKIQGVSVILKKRNKLYLIRIERFIKYDFLKCYIKE